ncbi:hypothetical protein MY1884_003528 [Beauveria asiatica]
MTLPGARPRLWILGTLAPVTPSNDSAWGTPAPVTPGSDAWDMPTPVAPGNSVAGGDSASEVPTLTTSSDDSA